MTELLEKLATDELNKLSKEELINKLINKTTTVEMITLVEKDWRELR